MYTNAIFFFKLLLVHDIISQAILSIAYTTTSYNDKWQYRAQWGESLDFSPSHFLISTPKLCFRWKFILKHCESILNYLKAVCIKCKNSWVLNCLESHYYSHQPRFSPFKMNKFHFWFVSIAFENTIIHL